MLNKTDIAMLSTLIVLTLTSGLVQYDQQIPLADTVPSVVDKKVDTQVPDFNQFIDVRQKKSAFFDFMKPLIEAENKRILEDREQVISLSLKVSLTESDQQWLLKIAKQYGVKNSQKQDAVFFETLLSRVDMIPMSLALVQSANESAWGTSRFAREGNNFFGQWCFNKGCGIVPASRPLGEAYEVRKFKNVAESVRSYMNNLNSHFQYDAMREMRQKRRQSGQRVTGPILAQGLYGYSIRGLDYVSELLSMIASNDLLKYDLATDVKPES